MIRFILKMVWREGRGSFRRFLSFLIAISLGVGSIVAVSSVAANLAAMTFFEARNLLAGDLEARLNRPLSPEGEEALSDLARRGIRFVRVTEMIGMASTGTAFRKGSAQAFQSQLVEIKAVEPGYPFYGRFVVDPPATDLFEDSGSVWVQEALLIRLGLHIGDPILLGDGEFTVRGIVRKEPDRSIGLFSLGPRVFLSQEGLKKTGLVQVGSRVTRRILFKATEAWTPESLKEALVRLWPKESVRLQTYREAQPRLGRFLENFTTYLGLAGLITLFIGGIAVASNIHAFLAERTESIAILKSLGSRSSTIMAIYLLLAGLLGTLGGLLGAALGIGIERLLLSLLSPFLPPGFSFQIVFSPIFRGIVMGIGTTLLFSLWPLQKVRQISPARVFRMEVETNLLVDEPFSRRSEQRGKRLAPVVPMILPLILPTMLGLAGLAVWQAGSWRLGGWVIGATAAAVLLLLAVTGGFLRLIRRAPRPRSLILRYGIGNLTRPGRQVVTVILSIGIGVLILLTLLQVEKNLLAQLRENIPESAPSLFFIDLQPDQKEPFEAMAAKWNLKKAEGSKVITHRPVELTPLVRSRLLDLNGKKVSEIDVEGRPNGWYFTREYVLTYQKELPPHNTLRRGTWWKTGNGESRVIEISEIPEISAETEVARHLGIDLGSTVTFDIQGVPVTGKITSIRDVDWGSFATNFFFIFEPTGLDGAPTTYVATASTPPEKDLSIQNEVTQAFPNVTVIPIREVLETIANILKEIVRTIRFMALFGMAVGLIVLSGAIAATRARRLHEMVLFKTLGATRPTLLAVLGVEYLFLGLIAVSVGGVLSVGLSWGIVHFLLDLPWRLELPALLIGSGMILLLTLLTGFLMSYRLLGQKPLAVLRSE